MHYDLMTVLYSFSCDFAKLNLTVFTTLHNSMRERIWNPFTSNSGRSKSRVKWSHDLCKTKNLSEK